MTYCSRGNVHIVMHPTPSNQILCFNHSSDANITISGQLYNEFDASLLKSHKVSSTTVYVINFAIIHYMFETEWIGKVK